MKSAEEWYQEQPCEEFTSITGSKWKVGQLKPDYCRQIQLDAYKQGMTDASEIVKGWTVLESMETEIVAALIIKAILTARDNKTNI